MNNSYTYTRTNIEVCPECGNKELHSYESQQLIYSEKGDYKDYQFINYSCYDCGWRSGELKLWNKELNPLTLKNSITTNSMPPNRNLFGYVIYNCVDINTNEPYKMYGVMMNEEEFELWKKMRTELNSH